MKDEAQIQFLNDKVNALNDNFVLIRNYFLEKSIQTETQKRMLESEQYLIHQLLDHFQIFDDNYQPASTVTEETQQKSPVPVSSSVGSSPNLSTTVNGPFSSPNPILELSPIPSIQNHGWPLPLVRQQQQPTKEKAATTPSPKEKSANISTTSPLTLPLGGSSPGRSAKGKESHAFFYRRQVSSTSPKLILNNQYPILPKKRKLPQQILFSPTPAHTHTEQQHGQPEQSAALELTVSKAKDMRKTITVAEDLGKVQEALNEVVKEMENPAKAFGEAQLTNNVEENGNEETNNSEKSTQVTNNVLVESYNKQVSESGASPSKRNDKDVVVEVEESEEIKVISGSGGDLNESGESEPRPPKLSPHTNTRSLRKVNGSSRRLPMHLLGSRKSSRTIRPSWKLNNSAETIMPLTSPDRLGGGSKDERGMDRMNSSSRFRKRRRSRTLSEEPPVLTSQVELPILKLDDMSLSGNKSSLQCEICKKVFSTTHGLRYHKESHMGRKPYQCSQCDKAFGQKSTLTRHLATTHTKIKAHVCNLCSKSFSSHSELNSHRGRHEAKRNVCPVCSRGFIDKRYFKLHVKLCVAKSINGSGAGGGGDNALFQCANCQKKYRDPNYFKKHVSLCSRTASA